MGLKQTLSFIINHPLNKEQKLKAIWRFIIWQFYSRLFNLTYIHKFTPKVKLIIKKGMTGATGNLYCGLHEFNDMAFLLHFLRSEDNFIDVGANIGSYTLLAAGHVGATTVSFEPVPKTFNFLEDNIALNSLSERVTTYNCAVGSNKGLLKFTNDQDTMNHIATSTDKNVFEVEIKTLDEIITENCMPSLIKIDVEGFETEVIKGMKNSLTLNSLKAIIIELNGSGERYGYDEKKIHQNLLDNDFKPFYYSPFKRKLNQAQSSGKGNTIYIRDMEFVSERLKGADEVKIFSKIF